MKAPTARDTAPSRVKRVTTLIQSVIKTIASITPQVLRKYAFGVQKKPSAMILMRASRLNTSAKAVSIQTNQFIMLKVWVVKYSFWYKGVVTQARITMATIAA